MLYPYALSDFTVEVNYLLNQWDPIGVADLVDDEYLCLVSPLLRRLSAGEGVAEVSEFLWFELQDHFGLDPDGCRVDEMANRLVAWAESVR